MKRGWAICPAGHWNSATAIDRIRVGSDGVVAGQTALEGENGTQFVLDLDTPAVVGEGDGIVLDDGGVIMVIGGVVRHHHHDH